MFGKLVKHEFIDTRKGMILVLGIMVLASIIGGICVPISENASNDGVLTMAIVFTGTGYSCLILMPFLAFISLCKNYWNSMFSQRGYLTHTLPVSANDLWNAKLLVSAIWILVTVILTILSYFFLVFLSGDVSIDEIRVMISSIREPLIYSNDDYVDINELYFFPYILFTATFGIIMDLMLIYTAMSLGQKSCKYKNSASIGYGIGFYVLIQATGALYFWIMNHCHSQIAEDIIQVTFERNVVLGLIPITLIFIIALYFINLQTVSKHLNLQ